MNIVEETKEATTLIQIPECELREIISVDVICRLCANQNDKLIGIYSDDGICNDLANKMNMYLPVKVSETDDLPLQCCWNCASTVLAWHDLVVTSVEADRRLRSYQFVIDKQLSQNVVFETEMTQSSEQTEEIKEEETENIDVINSPIHEEDENFCEKENDIKILPPEVKEDTSPKVQSAPNTKFSCEYCKKLFSRKVNYNNHLNIHKMERIEEESYSFKERNECFTEINRHKESVQNKFKCELCTEEFSRKILLKMHIKDIHCEEHNISSEDEKNENTLEYEQSVNFKDITCNLCNTNFETKIVLKKHMEDEHNIKGLRIRRKKSEIILQFFCSVCDKGFTRKYDMLKHYNNKHPNGPKIEPELDSRIENYNILQKCKVYNPDGEDYYKCDFCDKTLQHSYSFKRHRTIHTGECPFNCHICGKVFRLSGSLSRHINEFHNGVKKFSCEICGRRFSSKATTDEHMNIHTNNRPFVCDTCGKSFKQKASLHIHKMFHTDVFRFQCKVCSKKFRRNQDLKVHSWLHTGEKPYRCSICPKSFRLCQDLKRHIKVHSKIGECTCEICGSKFHQERYLKVHMKIHTRNPVLV